MEDHFSIAVSDSTLKTLNRLSDGLGTYGTAD